MTRIAHLSDIHFGRIAYPEIVDVLVEEINALSVDLVVVSGDLTQRARPRQFKEAVAMLDAFTAPVLVVPGNHDVYAWWHHPLLRMTFPLRRYEQYVTRDLLPFFENDSVAILGINSAHGWTIKGGRVSDATRSHMASYFSGQREGVFKVLVLHHPLMSLSALGKHDIIRQAQPVWDAVIQAGVNLVLCGHLHLSHVEAYEPMPGHKLIVASAGTATSNRWRAPQIGANYYNVIAITTHSTLIEERHYDPVAHVFKKEAQTQFKR